MKLVEELYPNGEELKKFFDKTDWVTLGKIINEAGDAINEMDDRKAKSLVLMSF